MPQLQLNDMQRPPFIRQLERMHMAQRMRVDTPIYPGLPGKSLQ
jgi:hypothetical protein